jgi:hypothetical protein
MKHLHRPSPAMAVAMTALVVAMVGTGYAASKINGSSIKKDSVPANRIEKNSLGGKQVKESKLGKVPSAAQADNATNADSAETVGGITVRRFAVKLPSGQGETALINVGGVTLNGRCEFGAPGQHGIGAQANPGSPSMVAAVTATNTGDDVVEAFKTANFGSLDLGAPGVNPPASIGHFIATTTTGAVTEVSYLAANAGNFSPNEDVCLFSGTATTG